MQVLTYNAHNVLGVKDIKFDLAGRHLFLVGGKNGQGKSSALMALIMALCGKSGMSEYPEIALRNGQKKGSVTIVLAGTEPGGESVTVELSLKKKPSGEVIEDFRVLDSDGKKSTEPRKLLQKLFALRAFDPLAFERMGAKEKATLVQSMLGLDLSKFDKDYAKVFQTRTDLGRDGQSLAAQLKAAGQKHEDVPVEEVKVVDLMTELETLQADKSREVNQKLIDDLKVLRRDLHEAVDAIVKDISALEERMKGRRAELEKTKEKIDATDKAEKETLARLDKLPDRTPDIAAVKEKIAKADETNRKVRVNKDIDRLEKEVNSFRGEYQKLSDRLSKIKEERAETVASAKWPIKGMELTEDGLLMDGLPFEQASTSQRIMASVAVGMALNPKLRLLVCQHGSDLDNDTLDALAKVVEQHKFQLLIELVTRSKEDEERCAVVISDGVVVGAEPEVEESSDSDDN